MTDAGMSGQETSAFRAALASEANPNHLFGFASALAPDYCVAACLLHARGMLLERRRVLGTAATAALLRSVADLADRTAQAQTPASTLVRRRFEIDVLARSNGLQPIVLYRGTREAACALVIDEQASTADLPEAVAALARTFVLTVGPVRVLDGAAVRLALPPTTGLATPEEREERARWTRHYGRSMRTAMVR